MILFKTQAVILRPGAKTNRGGSTVPDWSDSAVSRIPLPDVNLQADPQSETVTTDRDLSSGTAKLRTRPGVVADIRAGDRIAAEGRVWSVTGGNVPHRNPITGRLHHTVVTLDEWSGV